MYDTFQGFLTCQFSAKCSVSLCFSRAISARAIKHGFCKDLEE